MNVRNSLNSVARSLAVVGLIVGASACDNPVTPDVDHSEAVGVVITDLNGTVIAETHENHWDYSEGSDIHLHPGEGLELRVWFVSPSGERFQVIDSAEHQLVVEIADPSVATYDAHGDHGDLEGLAEGETTAVIHLWHGSHPGGHPDYSSPALVIDVVGHESH